MSRPRAADGGSSVLSFTFLDVLMCTMGSLLLLLVVFGVIAQKATRKRRDGEVAAISLAALSAPIAKPSAAAPGDAEESSAAIEDPAKLAQQLDELRTEQEKLEKLRAEAAETRRREQARIAHLEDHERRLEHELAKYNLALKALDDAEKKQHVDQAQAEGEVERLRKLVADAEERLAEMRTIAAEKSYAIVPYKGANGTFRRPVFIECTADAVTIQPEGIRLTVEDFDGPLRSGNPLAAAIRAAHEELNGRAAAAGGESPDAYPLLIVRPDGAAAYSVALDAIRSWDSDFGYEFVEADWNLAYPEPDPRLGQVMAHAVDEARQRQALLARVAPGQYAPRLGGGDGRGGGEGGGHGPGGGFVALSESGDGRIGSHAGSGSLGGGPDGANPLRGMPGGNGGTGGGNFSEEFAATGQGGSAHGSSAENRPGLLGTSAGDGENSDGVNLGPRYGGTSAGAAAPPAENPATSQLADSSNAEGGAAATGAAGGGATAGQPDSGGATGEAADAGQHSAGAKAGGGGGASSSMAGAAGSGATGTIGSSGAPPTTARGSIADSRGVNWANAEASRRASAITRPIRVQVNAEQIDVVADAGGSDGAVVPFHQPVDRVMDQLAGAVQSRIKEWGLAGDGMYWRPTLVVSVAPGADRQARRLASLLENSGIDVQLPEAIAGAAGGDGHATR